MAKTSRFGWDAVEDSLQSLMASVYEAEQRRQQWIAVRKWLIESMTADGISDEVQALVLEQWDKEPKR